MQHSQRLTNEFMTKYEYVKVITARADELKRGQEPHPAIAETLGDCIDVIEIARRELSARVLDLYIKRILPNGQEELWSVKDMNIRDH